VKLHANPILVELPNVFQYDIRESSFQEKSSTKQECSLKQCTDPSEGGGSTDIRYLFGGIRLLFDIRLFESTVEGASGIKIKLTKHKPSQSWRAFFTALCSCTMTGKDAGKTWSNLYKDLNQFYNIQIGPVLIIECSALMVLSGCGGKFQHMNSMLHQTVGSPLVQEAGNNWSHQYEDLEDCAKLHLFGKVSSPFNVSWVYSRLFLEDVFPMSSSLCSVFGLSRPELELYLSDCLLEILDGLAVSSVSNNYDVCRSAQLKYLESNSGIFSFVPATRLTVVQVSNKVGILEKISNFGYRSTIHRGAFNALGMQSDFYRRYKNDPEQFSAFFINSQKYGSFVGFRSIFSHNNQTHLHLQGDVVCADPLTIVRTDNFSTEYHPNHRNMVNELRSAEGVRVIININNFSSDFLRNVKVSTPNSPELERGPVGIMIESMMVEGLSVMEELNAIFILRDLHTPSEDHDDLYAWWRTVLGQRLEKVVRTFSYQLTGRSLPYIKTTSLYEFTAVPHRGFSNQLTPVTASFKRRQNKRKCKQSKITEEKERLESVPESIPIQNRLGPFKKFRFARNIDDRNESGHLSEQNVIASAPTKVMDETPSTSRGKSQSKSIHSRLGGEKPKPGGQRLGGQRGILKRRLGGVVHKECPWENRIGSLRYSEYPTGTWG